MYIYMYISVGELHLRQAYLCDNCWLEALYMYV